MKNIKFSIIVLFLVVFAGCMTVPGFKNPTTQETVTKEELKELPADKQKEYTEPVNITIVKPEVANKIDTGLQKATDIQKATQPYVPEPFATGSAIVIGGLTGLWGLLKSRKTSGVLEQVKLGAEITAKTVDDIIKPSTELYEQFKKQQKASASNTNAIMPDKVTKAVK